jgi:hypothetical protein
LDFKRNLTAYSFKEPTIEKELRISSLSSLLSVASMSSLRSVSSFSVFFLFFVFFGEKGLEGGEEGFCFRIFHVGTLSCRPTRGASSVWTTRTWALLGWDFDLTQLDFFDLFGAMGTDTSFLTTMMAYCMQLDPFIKWELFHCCHCHCFFDFFVVGMICKE